MLARRKLRIDSGFVYLCLITLLYVSFYLPMGSTVPTVLLLGWFFLQGGFRVRFVNSFYIGYVIVFIAFCYISCLWATNASYTLLYTNHILKSIFGMLVVYVALYHRKDRMEILLKTITIGGYIVLAYATAFFGIDGILSILRESGRISDNLMNANNLAMCLAYGSVVHIYYAVKNKKWNLWHLLLIPALVILAVSGSRKGMTVWAVGLIGIYVWNEYRKPVRTFVLVKILAIAVVAFIGFYFLLQLPMFTFLNIRISNMFRSFTGATDVDNSLLARSTFIEIGWDVFLKHPLLGVGINNAKLYNYREVYLHNNFVEMLANGGIVGFFTYYSMYVYLLWKYIKNRKQMRTKEHMGLCFVLLFITIIVHWAHVAYRTSMEYYTLLVVFFCLADYRKTAKKVSDSV